MRMDPASIRLPGAVDLGALAPAGGGGVGNGATDPSAVFAVTEATFSADVLERSRTVPVVLDFWASWCGPCRQLSPVLERLAAADDGAWVLATIDVDANPRLAQAAQVQGIPAVKAVWDGQVVAEFTGAMPEADVRRWLDALLAAVGQARAGAVEGSEAELPEDPILDRAEAALGDGDLLGARDAFAEKLAQAPADPHAKLGLARVELMIRVAQVDEAAARARLAADPDDVEAAAAVADIAVADGAPEEGLAALTAVVRRTAGPERDRARAHLLGLFDALGEDDPAVPPARRALANALF